MRITQANVIRHHKALWPLGLLINAATSLPSQGPGGSETKPRTQSASWEQRPFIRRAVKSAGAVCEGLTHVTEATAFSMEGPTDNLSIEDEAGGEVEMPGRATEDAAQSGSPEELAPTSDSGPADKVCAVEPAAACCPTATESPAADGSQPPGTECSTHVEPHTSAAAGLSQPSQAPAPTPCPPRTPKASIAEMDCLICFNRYSPSRLPKLLACQHAFCAVCLKLILRNEDHTWIITCPLCRKATVVFGGLICSLHDKEDVLDRLDSPDPEAEVPRPPRPADASQRIRWSISGSQDPRSNRAAAKRLMLLLLLVVMLIALVLPFLYTGLLKLALCTAVVLGLIISAVLCCNPSWNCPDPPWLPWRRKETHVVSVA